MTCKTVANMIKGIELTDTVIEACNMHPLVVRSQQSNNSAKINDLIGGMTKNNCIAFAAGQHSLPNKNLNFHI